MKMPNFQAQNGPLAPNDIFFQKQCNFRALLDLFHCGKCTENL